MDVNGLIQTAHLMRPNLETVTYRQMTAVDVWGTVLTVPNVKRDPRPKIMPEVGGGGKMATQHTAFHALASDLPAGFEGKYKDQIVGADGSYWSVDIAELKTTGNIWRFDVTRIAAVS